MTFKPRSVVHCPAECGRTRRADWYLCSGCWHALPDATRRRLSLRDDWAGMRLLELRRQLRHRVPLTEIEVSP